MVISNLTPKSMIINNSNKTEMLMGYGTLHGDMIGAINVIGDLNKKEVYALARYINQKDNNIIPETIISKPASAELNVDQVDPFDYDRVSEAIDELGNGASPEEVVAKYDITLPEAQDYARRIPKMEYKRREFYPIILKLKSQNMGIGRRYPVVRKV
jgi:NAD+ synthase (glutamine-hydrolysing)